MLQRPFEVRKELARVLAHGEMPEPSHFFKDGTSDVGRSGSARIRCTAIVILTSEHINRAMPRVNLTNSFSAVPPSEVELEIPRENSCGLGRIDPPIKSFIDGWGGWRHHATYSLRGQDRLITRITPLMSNSRACRATARQTCPPILAPETIARLNFSLTHIWRITEM
ncbi:Phosphate metabolism protein 7 [Fusarium oxysporum f. sp. albedinis]|nr:Phosphate metabolism protein 7 [Fusarium oxysporum f. sp. albedinis]